MTATTPREVVTGFFDDLNAGQAEAAFARLAPDVVYRVVAPEPHGGTVNAQGLAAKAFAVFERLAEPLRMTRGRIVADGDLVVVEARGDAPTRLGGRYDNDYLLLYRVIDGTIVEACEYLDSAKYVALMEGRL